MKKETIRDKIDSLEFQREPYKFFYTAIIPAIIGITSFILAYLIYLIQDPQNNWDKIFMLFGLFLFFVVVVGLGSVRVIIRDTRLRKRIAKEYTLLIPQEEKRMKKSNWWKRTFTVARFWKAFLTAVVIGLGAYFGKLFLEWHWLWALVFVTIFLMLFAGKLLDALYPEYE